MEEKVRNLINEYGMFFILKNNLYVMPTSDSFQKLPSSLLVAFLVSDLIDESKNIKSILIRSDEYKDLTILPKKPSFLLEKIVNQLN